MEEKTIVDWETENKSPTIELSRVDARLNRVEVDLIVIESEPAARLNTRQNWELTEEQGELAKQGAKIDLAEEVEEEPTVPNGVEDTPLERGEPPEVFRMKNVYC